MSLRVRNFAFKVGRWSSRFSVVIKLNLLSMLKHELQQA